MSVSPPRPRGPHLNALRAFESAARRGGFSAAADELCVTPGAVSQQIKSLEDWAGAPLFERRSQGVKLTALGASILKDTTSAFDLLGSAQRRLRHGAERPLIAIAALPAVAQIWLSPRMPAIRAALPECEISITALEQPPNLERELFDLTLFIGKPDEAAGDRILAEDSLTPVCTPALAARLTAPRDALHQPLLHDAVWQNDWPDWFSAARVPCPATLPGPRHSLYALALEEARHGAGLLIGHTALLGDALEQGALVAPFRCRLKRGSALVARLAYPASPVARRIRALLAG